MMEDQEYLLLMSTIAQAQTTPENPVVAGRFVSKVIDIHNQAAAIPEAPVMAPQTESSDGTDHPAPPTSSIPDTDLILNHIIPAETITKQTIRNTLHVTLETTL